MIAYRNSSVAGYMDSCYVDQATDQQIRECLEEYPRWTERSAHGTEQ